MKTSIFFKKIIYSTFALTFGIQMVNAQSEIRNPKSEIDSTVAYRNNLFNSGKVTLGFKAGYTHSNLYGSEIEYIFAERSSTALPSFHLGLTVNSQAGKNFFLKHEILLNQRGAEVILTDINNGNYNSKIKMLYLDLYPASSTFQYKDFRIYAGPYISALTIATIQRKDENGKLFKDKSIFGDPGNREGEGENKYLQKFDFGLNAGIEYRFPIGLLLGIQYNHGFTDIFQYANSYTNEDTKLDEIKIFNRALMVSLIYSIDNNKK